MNLILNIDTALGLASVCLAKDGKPQHFLVNEEPMDHAAWLHKAVVDVLEKSGYKIRQLQAVAVNMGPGSYTGLRVGMAADKGFSYALEMPLIVVNSLEILAFAVVDEAAGVDLICPMVDARRMEVFTAVYDKGLDVKVGPQAMVVNENSYSGLLSSNKILFCGCGSKKFRPILNNPNAFFSTTSSTAIHLAQLSHKSFQKKQFADRAYAEPLYIKEFYSPAHRPIS